MTWLILGYGAGLLFLAINHNKLADKAVFSTAWILFAMIPISRCVFALLTLANVTFATIGLWSQCIEWLLLGVSFLLLFKAIIPYDQINSKPSVKLSDSMSGKLGDNFPDNDKKDLPSYP